MGNQQLSVPGGHWRRSRGRVGWRTASVTLRSPRTNQSLNPCLKRLPSCRQTATGWRKPYCRDSRALWYSQVKRTQYTHIIHSQRLPQSVTSVFSQSQSQIKTCRSPQWRPRRFFRATWCERAQRVTAPLSTYRYLLSPHRPSSTHLAQSAITASLFEAALYHPDACLACTISWGVHTSRVFVLALNDSLHSNGTILCGFSTPAASGPTKRILKGVIFSRQTSYKA